MASETNEPLFFAIFLIGVFAILGYSKIIIIGVLISLLITVSIVYCCIFMRLYNNIKIYIVGNKKC